MKQSFKVSIQPDGKNIHVLDGTSIYEALGEAGIIIKSECGGSGVCGSCKVRVLEGKYEQHGSERHLSKEDIDKGLVLACSARVLGDMKVEIPTVSRVFEQKILTKGLEKEVSLSPGIRKLFVEAPKPSLDRKSVV